ncbi:transcriptional regulator family: Fungal Specific TF [Penicillium maclennaniae]|uniref:transcriptional regulator family: Fungal Specific TF n=1 Tax=Penicillium maclennaniae TaxID=1343394 RepID=UPI0025408E02|nr:transcriptional regulator family: Fungal Specific TF [Penicillium maclennaniae]KAJ5665996.1 transcriptional regulator family: Fungal Specific TF [Penicillium maclennaniae]
MSEPTDPNSGDSTGLPTESNAPATETSQPPAPSGQPTEETHVPSNSNHGSVTMSEPPSEPPQPAPDTNQQVSTGNPQEETHPSAPAPAPNVTSSSIDHALPAMDSHIPSLDFDTELPSIGSSADADLSLPAIDTTLPSLDSALPAIGTDIPTMEEHEHHSFDNGFDHHDHHHNGSVDSGNNFDQHSESMNDSSHYQTPVNGNYHYSPTPQQPDGQQPPQGQSQHQFQSQPPNYQQQSPDMYHNPGGFSSVNSNSGNNGQGQPGQVPQAPIGSPMPAHMPPMASMGQYMTGYPSNGPQNPNSQMRYPLPGDPNKILSGGRHKKEVKRRTKTGCLTCRKRRIKLQTPPPSLVVNPQGPPPVQSTTPSYPSAPPGYMPASSQPFAPSLHSESPSASTDQPEQHHVASVDHTLGAHNNIHHSTNMQNSGEFRPQSLEPTYRATYAPAIDKLLEVRWFSEKALSVLMADSQLMADYSALINAFNEWNLADRDTLARLESFEASIIWRSMVLCRQVPSAENGQYGQDWNLLATNARLNAIEALLSWNHMDQNALSRPLGMDAATPPNSPDQFMQRQLDFWSELGDFLTLHDNEASSAKQIDDTLSRLRSMLDTYENRDIIYSIAIARHLGQRWADFPHNPPKMGYSNEKESGTKLFVAQKFIEEEAEGKGTTQVYKRICCMAVRSWWVARE